MQKQWCSRPAPSRYGRIEEAASNADSEEGRLVAEGAPPAPPVRLDSQVFELGDLALDEPEESLPFANVAKFLGAQSSDFSQNFAKKGTLLRGAGSRQSSPRTPPRTPGPRSCGI